MGEKPIPGLERVKIKRKQDWKLPDPIGKLSLKGSNGQGARWNRTFSKYLFGKLLGEIASF
jgi:hypothetical protein